jgi:threonine dehydrogenase-like Zn-dependent dehydrogenase
MHAEKFLAASNACHHLPDDVPWAAGVLLTGDGLGVPYHTSRKIDSPDIQTVAIIGTGPIGLGNVLMQSYLGRRVISADLSATRVKLAKMLGADAVINASQENTVEMIHHLTNGTGADVCIEAAGEPETALECFAAVRTGGTVVFNGEQKALPISPSDHFIRRDITAVGSWFYHFSEFASMLKLYREGLQIESLITDHFPFTDAAAAYSKFAARETGKVLLDYR